MAGQTNETCSPTERESANPKHRPPTIPIDLPTLPLLLLLLLGREDPGSLGMPQPERKKQDKLISDAENLP